MHSKIVCRRASKLLNLTSKKLSVYASDGTIVVLPSVGNTIPTLSWGTYLIVTEEQFQLAKEIDRGTCDLVEPYSTAIGRDRVEITSLRLYDDTEVRVYPDNY